ncbi:PREDICTED: uncharacterized protein LOC104754009 [Camelina sativa]|uniref:Uncharacterized protein LOC104754009 n=1 Tax=Camelina sativa TaxID=90675 RepID=A0ABM0WQ00_CAMSA|nr:PREDICTED: uncharacterized protein LOC104754009 [Camelina sativa]
MAYDIQSSSHDQTLESRISPILMKRPERDSSRLITSSADQTAKLWDVQSGEQLFTFKFGSPARFYEWKKEGSKKQPYYIHFEDGRPLVFAALYDSWQNSGGETLYTFTILTTSSSSALHWLHDRMPVILGDKDSVDTWLDDPSTTKLQPLLSPYEKSDLVWYPVTAAIGKPTFDGPECIQQMPLKASQNSLISKFFSTKQPKTDKETKSTDITADLKEEPTVDSIKKMEEVDEDISNEASNLGFQKIVKVEPFVEDKSAVVKDEVEEVTNGEGKSMNTGLTKETGESNASLPAGSCNLDFPIISKEEPETQDHHRYTTLEELIQPHEAVEDKPGNENQKTDLTYQTSKEGGLEFSEKSSGKTGTKRDYEVFSAQEKPLKHCERLEDVKSSGRSGRKQGKGKSNIKKSKETQSTLHFFFNEK